MVSCLGKDCVKKSECITSDDLPNYIDIDKFNTMIENTSNAAIDFINSFNKEQQEIKDNIAKKKQEQEDERYNKTANDQIRSMIDKHKEIMKELYKTYDTLKYQLQSTSNTRDLYKVLTKENILLEKKIEDEVHTIEISDRKTYYESEENSTAAWWAKHFKSKYFYLVILLIVGIFLKKRFHEIRLWIIVIGVALYPIVAFYLVGLVTNLYYWIKSKTRWVYLHQDM